MDKLLTQQDLADRWQVTTNTIRDWRLQGGVITPVKGIPAIRFTEQHIQELEGGVELERISPLQVKRLERELEEVKAENEKLKGGILSNILAETSQVIGM